MKIQPEAAAAVIGLAVVSLHTIYNDSSPSLTDLRNAPEGDPTMRTLLMDCDLYVGGLALVIGIGIGWMSRRIEPVVILVLGFLLVSGYRHAVVNSNNGR